MIWSLFTFFIEHGNDVPQLADRIVFLVGRSQGADEAAANFDVVGLDFDCVAQRLDGFVEFFLFY